MDEPDKFAEFASLTVAGVVAWLWKHTTGRISALEERHVAKATFQEHSDDHKEKFETLFRKHDKLSEKVSEIHSSVSRIEGVLSRRREDRKTDSCDDK